MRQLDGSHATIEMEAIQQVADMANLSDKVDLNSLDMWQNKNITLDYSNIGYSTYPPEYYYDISMWNASAIEVPLLKQPPHMVGVYCLAYGLVFITALFGNGLVLALVIREPSMRNVTNYFIVNLAAADYLVALIIVPMTLLNSIFSGRY